MLIKLHMHEGQSLSDALPVHNGLKQGGCFKSTALLFCSRIWHQDRPRESGRAWNEWLKSDTSLCWLC